MEWSEKKCPGFENKELYLQFRAWREAPHVKTRKQLRQEAFREQKTACNIHNFRKARSKKSP